MWDDGYDGFDADLYVKGQKENIIDDVACACCGRTGVVSEWDISTRDGNCADCFWGRCPKGADKCDARVRDDGSRF